MFLQHFIIEGKLLGTAQRKLKQVHEDRIIPWSYAFFCQHCGEVWARCPVETLPGKHTDFVVLKQPCRKHKRVYGFVIPGSLHLNWDEEFSKAFPDDVVRWEFERLLESF